jgi:hypothetical protein
MPRRLSKRLKLFWEDVTPPGRFILSVALFSLMLISTGVSYPAMMGIFVLSVALLIFIEARYIQTKIKDEDMDKELNDIIKRQR